MPIDFIPDCTLVLYKQLFKTGFGCYPSYFPLSWAFLSTSPQPMGEPPHTSSNFQWFFTKSAHWADSVRLSLHKSHFPVDWRLLVKERIANISITIEILDFCRFDDFSNLILFLGVGVFANQPTVHNGGVSKESRWLWLLTLVTGGMQHVTPNT